MKSLNIASLLVPAAICAVIFFILHYQFAAYTERYAIAEAEKLARDVLLTQQAVHQYVADVSRPEIYRLQDEGLLEKSYYSPIIMSRTFQARKISENLNLLRMELDLPQLQFKLATDNPRNEINRADALESSLLQQFRQGEINEYRSIINNQAGEPLLYFARPTPPNTASCLKCHGLPEDAPAEMVKLYPGAKGYHEETDKIRALISIRIPLNGHLHAGQKIAATLSLTTLISLMIIFSLFIWAQARNNHQQRIILHKNRDLEGLTQVQQQFMLADIKTSFEQMLTLLLDSSQSEYGFLGEVHYQDNGIPWLKTHALTNIAWNEETRQLYQEKAAEGFEFCSLKTLFGVSLTTGEPVISNSPEIDPRSGGLPSGHPPLRSFMAIPLLHENRFVGLAGIANRPGGYSTNILEELSPITATITSLICAAQLERKRRATELELENTNAELERFFTTSLDLLCILNLKREFIRFNPQWEKVLGYSVAELMGQTLFDFIHPDDLPATMGKANLLNQRVEVINFENRYRHKDGSWRWLEWRSTLKSGLIYATARDVTARRLAEDELKQAGHELARSNEELEQFAYVISHDLRQPLRMISSYMQLLENHLGENLDQEARQMMHFAADGAMRMNEMLVGVLEYSRAGRKGEPPETLSSREMLDEVLLFLQPAISESKADIEILGDWPIIHAPRDEFTRLLQNLIDNAIKYRAPDQSPTISVESSSAGEEQIFCITDNGIGIDPDQQQRLFKVFQRLHTRQKYQGTGVGLAICRKIVERQGGRIWIESPGAGCGSRFCFSLPISLPISTSGETPS